ncbi:MAG: GNAT family N-acetyltransferase [Anaerolineales bacterium]|nr:GNAT family N-acetyltransferase [Anaerolineales bacterium]
MEKLDLSILIMAEADIPDITPVMKRAFDDDAQKHLGKESGGPPGYDNGDFFRTWLVPYQESVGYKIFSGEILIGGIIVWILPEKHNILGTIFVDPAYQDRGVGQKTWNFIEDTYPETISWRLETPDWATKNHYFYEKCGFEKVESDPLIPQEEDSVIYRKDSEKFTSR